MLEFGSTRSRVRGRDVSSAGAGMSDDFDSDEFREFLRNRRRRDLEAERATWIDGELFEDTWNRREDFRRHGDLEWKGYTIPS